MERSKSLQTYNYTLKTLSNQTRTLLFVITPIQVEKPQFTKNVGFVMFKKEQNLEIFGHQSFVDIPFPCKCIRPLFARILMIYKHNILSSIA